MKCRIPYVLLLLAASAFGLAPERLLVTTLKNPQLASLNAHQYAYDGMRVIQERDVNNTPLVSYTRGNDLSGSLKGAGGIGGLLGRSHGYSGGNWSTHNYYHADGAGNVTYLVNSNQTLAASYRYDPYGNLLTSSGTLAAANAYRFSSKELHLNSGLYSYGYRFYSPNWQRWLNQDPVGEWGGLNLYGYVGNSPVNFYDSYGLAIGDWWDARTWFNNGFTESWSDQANSIGQTLGDLLAGNWDNFGNNYDDSTLGQAEAPGPGVHTATKVCIGAATVVATAAVAVGTFEFAALGNQSIMVEGVLGGGRMGSGGLFQLRVAGRPPIIRFDFHPFPGTGGRPLPHVNSPPLGWHHWPWQ